MLRTAFGWVGCLALFLVACGGVAEPKQCFVGGCSGQVCADTEGLVSTCEWRAEYACYKSAHCEVQGNGECGWTPSAELSSCIADANQPTGEFCGGIANIACPAGKVCVDNPNDGCSVANGGGICVTQPSTNK